MIKATAFAAMVLYLAIPAIAQTPDAHAGHTTPAAVATAPLARAATNHDATRRADRGAMGSMAMPGGTVMQMPATPKLTEWRDGGPAEAALQAFTDAIEVGNRDLVIALLAPELVVVENGSEDDYAGYVGGHLASDIAFSKTVKTLLLTRKVERQGENGAVITSTSRMTSNRSDRKIELDVAETATLTKVGRDWKVSRLAWQSVLHPAD